MRSEATPQLFFFTHLVQIEFLPKDHKFVVMIRGTQKIRLGTTHLAASEAQVSYSLCMRNENR